MGLVNTVVPLERLEEETVAVVPRDARALAVRAAAAEGQLQRRRGRPRRHPAARPRRQPALLRAATRRRRGARPTRRSAAPTSRSSRGGREPRASAARIWLMAARPRTLPAAVAPVLVGTALAATRGRLRRVCAFVAALLGALFIQVGTNLSNDYSDARRGADTEDRLGPVRVTAGGLVPPRQVLVATYVAFGLAVLVRRLPRSPSRAGILLRDRRRVDPRRRALHGRPAALRLRGPRRGLRVPVLRRRRRRRLVLRRRSSSSTWEAFALAVPVGLLAAAILVVNNVRDLETDRRAGKRTLAVRLGRDRARGPLRGDGLPWRSSPRRCRGWLGAG